MKFVKITKNLTACLIALILTACVSKKIESSIDNNEAMKARLNLALAYLKQNNYPKAKLNIDRAIEHNNQDYLPYSVLAYYYQQIGNNKKAIENYQQAIILSKKDSKTNSPSPSVLNNYGTFLCLKGQFEEAYQQFELALQSELPYYHQADTLENIIICAQSEHNKTKKAHAFIQLEKIDSERAKQLKHKLKIHKGSVK